MRNMSFALTRKQVIDKKKFVTRRLGWWFLKPGDIIQPVEKCMGLRKGEKIKKIGGPIEVVSTRAEPLTRVDHIECELEGFPDMEPEEFIWFFAKHNQCHIDEKVNRIAFRYL